MYAEAAGEEGPTRRSSRRRGSPSLFQALLPGAADLVSIWTSPTGQLWSGGFDHSVYYRCHVYHGCVAEQYRKTGQTADLYSASCVRFFPRARMTAAHAPLIR